MSSDRGIFDNLSNPGGSSPFTAVNAAAPAPSPLSPVERADSPFSVVDEPAGARQVEPGKPAKLPERRPRSESPFQIAEVPEAFGYATPIAFAAGPPPPSAFSAAPAPPSPAFGGWRQTPAPFQAMAQTAPGPVAQTPSAFAAPPPRFAKFQPPAHAPAPTPSPAHEQNCSSIRQIELRAIFGVDHEMSVDEILQRSRGLTGIRHIARIGSQELSVFDSVKPMLAGLGFGTGGLKISVGSVPIEFIREGNVLLAVQTDGGFAPGVRETLMLVARELGRTA